MSQRPQADRGEEGRCRFGATEIRYRVVRSARRQRVAISVGAQAGVVVRLPAAEAGSVAAAAVARKAAWIVQRLALLRARPAGRGAHEFVEGETFLYLGRQYRLKLVQTPGDRLEVRLLGRSLTVAGPRERQDAMALRQGVELWYRRRAAAKLRERVARYAERLGVDQPRVVIRDQRKRWGSCSRAGVLRFNWRIMMAPLTLVDYVVAHELCHLLVPDHSPRFWRLVRRCLPDAEARRQRLLDRGPEFGFP
jgi:predicted metal-dependent hydrolase